MLDVDLLPDGVVIADAHGTVVRVNAAAARVLRRRPDELTGRHVAEALPLDDLAGNSWFDCIRPYDGLSIRSRISEGSWHTPDGEELLVTATLVRDKPRGPVERLIISLRSANARAHRERARSDLVATVAHELRSPLTGVKGFTATLLNNWDRFSDEQRKLMLTTIDSDADRLTRLITDLLDAARIDSGRLTVRPQPLDPVEAVTHVLQSVSAASGLDLVPTVDGEPSRAWVDPDRLAQVVTNLVENAQRHGQGVRDVTVRPAGDGRDGFVLVVSDFGAGIPASVQDRMFTRFWHSGERGGTGLGLYIVKGIVDGHHGTVTVGEGPDGGAQVAVWFPENRPDVLRG